MKSACLKDDKRVEIISRNNSLCAKGRISVVSQAEPNTLFQPAIHVVQLGMVLRCFAEGWNRIHPHFLESNYCSVESFYILYYNPHSI